MVGLSQIKAVAHMSCSCPMTRKNHSIAMVQTTKVPIKKHHKRRSCHGHCFQVTFAPNPIRPIWMDLLVIMGVIPNGCHGFQQRSRHRCRAAHDFWQLPELAPGNGVRGHLMGLAALMPWVDPFWCFVMLNLMAFSMANADGWSWGRWFDGSWWGWHFQGWKQPRRRQSTPYDGICDVSKRELYSYRV